MKNKIYKHNDGPCKELTKDISILIDVLNSLVEDNGGEFKFEYATRETNEFPKVKISIRFYFIDNMMSENNKLIKEYIYSNVEDLANFFKSTYKDILRMIIFTRDFDNGAIKCTEYAKLIRNYGK